MDSSNTLSTSQPRPHNAVYNTPAGRNLVRQILSSCVPPVEPHDYQLDGLCFSLDGYDVVATMATGTGKTSFFIFLMLVIRNSCAWQHIFSKGSCHDCGMSHQGIAGGYGKGSLFCGPVCLFTDKNGRVWS
ncbi:hypothetical protein L208DRAFT_131996 [Tricholoma matsutake]|nr:hypothetical protein L208DRAFT_131996 [Tricholoma matsutake 945]